MVENVICIHIHIYIYDMCICSLWHMVMNLRNLHCILVYIYIYIYISCANEYLLLGVWCHAAFAVYQNSLQYFFVMSVCVCVCQCIHQNMMKNDVERLTNTCVFFVYLRAFTIHSPIKLTATNLKTLLCTDESLHTSEMLGFIVNLVFQTACCNRKDNPK